MKKHSKKRLQYAFIEAKYVKKNSSKAQTCDEKFFKKTKNLTYYGY